MKTIRISTNEDFRKFKERIKGNYVVIAGKELEGKTIFTLKLSKFFSNPLRFDIDLNIDEEILKKINPNIGNVKIYEPDTLRKELRKLYYAEKAPDVIILDSLSSLKALIVRELGYGDQSKWVIYSEHISKLLNLIWRKHECTIIIVTHLAFNPKNQKYYERLSGGFKRYLSQIWRFRREGNTYILELVFERGWYED